jgi:hypothetical protein
MPVTFQVSRTFLRHFLIHQKHEPIYNKLVSEALQGLRALDYGEMQPLFAPLKTKAKGYGSKPHTLRILRMKALGVADLLIAKKFQPEEGVLRFVANKLDENAGTFRKWRTENQYLGKTTDQHIKSFRQGIANKTEWDIPHILAELDKLAKHYLKQQALSKPPTTKKKEKRKKTKK